MNMNHRFADLTKSKIFFVCCIVFIVGIGVASFLPVSTLNHKLTWFSLAISFLAATVIFWPVKILRITSLAGLFLFLSFWCYATNLVADGPERIWHYNGQNVKIVGIVTGEPDEREGTTQLKIETSKIKIGENGYRKVSGMVLVTTNLFPERHYGDELELECKLKKPDDSFFAYDRYLARYDIYSVCYYPQAKLLAAEEGNRFYSIIFKFKNIVRSQVESALPEPEAGLARGFLLGDLKGLDQELSQDFSRAGLSHIVAISGANISILAGMVMAVSSWLGIGRRPSFYFSSVFLAVYIILVGAPASAMRAGLMGFLVLWALYLGRLSKTANTLAFAAALMLVFNPRLLRDDIGFQLSFLALLGLIYINPILESWLDRFMLKRFFGIREVVLMSISAQVLSLPVIIYNFSQFSIISLAANVLVLWTLPALMIILPFAVLAGAIFKWLSVIIFTLPYLILKYIVITTQALVELPYAYLAISFRWWFWAIGLAYYIYWMWAIFRKKESAFKSSGNQDF